MFASFFTTLGGLPGRAAARLAIGVDVGTKSIKAVQVERGANGIAKVVAAMCRPRGAIGPLTADEVVGLADAVRQAGFVGSSAVFAAPPADAIISTIELPPRSSNAPLDQLARMEMARNTRIAPDSFELAWWEMPPGARNSRGTHAMAVAVPHAKADSLLDTVEPGGFDVAALDLEPTALSRACATALSPTGITAILDLGNGPATLTLVHGRTITFNRRLPEVAAGALQEELCRRLAIEADVAEFLLAEIGVGTGPRAQSGDADDAVELPDEGRREVNGFVDAMTKELALSFDYAGHLYPDAPVSRLLLTGGGAAMAGLVEKLSAALSVEVRRVAPATLVTCDPGLLSVCSSPAMTLALGLAMREPA
ncbi:pilus assembly protein PilM [Humisphaera borealis]|uniref:Pilus assembly protein PilM n=1 Tax=Humisphaera borealis TaxID=2807512 RepID=A0A7M2X2Q4_9BACT|nr:pilus assembly protein PilM [Humisphaera borealis]QOV92046.1 pilus assembly protein PilM [Humisphaera borealis]